MMLVGTLITAAVVNQHQFKIPGMRVNVSARKIFILWGAIWLGVPGAVLLAVFSSLAKHALSIKDKNHWLLTVFANVVAGFGAAQVFYLVLNSLTNFDQLVVGAASLGGHWFVLAACLMTLAHYISISVLNAIFVKLESGYPILSLWKDSYSYTLLSYAISLGVALLLHFAFIQFGSAFGLVLLPASIIGHLVYRIYLKRLEEKTREIREASRIHIATVEALATAIDARDQVGVGHVRRTQIYAVGVGEILDLSDADISALHAGALLHDIGKLAVPDHILNKTGRLTAGETEKMKIHAAVGASILEKVNFPYPVVPTVRHHHEAWDGSGYPSGLQREEIPLTARILTIADSYDTLRGARAFKESASREEARKFLLSGAGVQYDPKLVDVFLRNLRKFESQIEAQGLSYESEYEQENLFNTIESQTGEDQQGYVTQIKRANREVSALYELARIFSASLNLQDTLSLFVKKIGELVPFETCVIYLFDKNSEYTKAIHVEGLNAEALLNRQVKPGEGATGYVLKKRQPLHNVNPAMDFSFYQQDFIQDYTAMASLPLVSDENLLGAVSLYSCELQSYEDEHMRLLDTVSRIASDAISKSLHHAETESKALTDPMTGLPNARSLQMQFETEVARARRNDCEFQVLMLDLDGFKSVNDTFGHKTGDLLLKEVSRVMRGQLREYDFLARYAGDEFVVIIPETSEKDIADLCERIERAVLDFKLPTGDGRTARVGVSLGSACYPKSGETLDQVIIAADKAMYSVKAKHKQKKAAAQQPQPTVLNSAKQSASEIAEEPFIVELDESHIISSAVN